MGCAKRVGEAPAVIANLGFLPLLLLLCSLTVAQSAAPPPSVNLNTATAAQLETLPGIGPGLAQRILEYRRKHGPFKRPQDLIIVRGFSAKRFRQLAPWLTV